ncbi:MAG: two-component system sensor histidine kinase CreC [Verrucomicrobiales bacterium]
MRLTRITLLIIALIIGSGFYLLVRRQLAEVEPQTFQATEEAMVDIAHLLASFVEADLNDGGFEPDLFRTAFKRASQRTFSAPIYQHLKVDVGLGAYITDARGVVLFDSRSDTYIGEDRSALRDVNLCLQGVYGARSSREQDSDSSSSVLYIAAPIGPSTKPWGVLTISKPQADVLPIVHRRRSEIWWGTGLIGGGILFLVAAVFVWQYRPIGLLTEYARSIEQGGRPDLPKLGAGREVNTLANALQSMRESLEGRRYAERYVQTLTHEMKSPLAAIRGAAELLQEDMPAADRTRFLYNIRAESARAERLINRLLELSALEGRSQLDSPERVDFLHITQRALDQAQPMAELAGVALEPHLPSAVPEVRGDAFMLRAAITNLLENAIDFSPAGESVSIALRLKTNQLSLHIEDRGPGIPDYAKDKVFDRFFSLRHLKAGRKGTGLGLTLVKEALDLHHGSIHLEPVKPHGTRATLTLPI